MTLNDGRYDGDTAEDILDAMVADAKEYWGEDLHDDQLAIIRTFYRPIAIRLAETQADIGLVLDSAQIDHANGAALELLTALIGVRREEAQTATGEAQFSRDSSASQDYIIPSGTIVQTDSNDPVRFETTEAVTLTAGDTSVTTSIEAVEAGVQGNTGANTITIMPDGVTGIDSVTNPAATDGGENAETDDELRERAKRELAEGSRSSAPALINSVRALDGVTSVSIFINNGNLNQIPNKTDDGFELVVAGGNDGEIGQEIRDSMAAGDTSHYGQSGTGITADANLGNGQSLTTGFSRPTEVQIYVDMSLEVTDNFGGEDEVRDSIVSYIGGLYTSGQEATGLNVGEDVIYGEIEYFIRDVEGVHDVTDLQVDTSSSPAGTSNITIANSEVATADGTDSSLTMTTTQV